MFGWQIAFRRKTPDMPDPLEFHDELIRHNIGDDYTHGERYADFTKTFMLDPVGKRVLFQIFEWGGMFTGAPLEDAAMQRYEGGRSLCIAIMTALKAQVSEAEDLGVPAPQEKEDV